ncbi:hypothetical protein [Flavobacterium oreochromis]|nr:hypothetical protein [Flavobacterium oreochromis]POR20546.1 hypothetical protein BWK58_13965 [Flavobacterium columnare]QYS86347.1 hypothetical protein JJC03_15735 [Flavobacterium oreochromis]
MKNKLLHTFLIITLISCNKNGKSEIIENDKAKNKTVFKLDFFKTIPDTIDGCGDYFTLENEKSVDQNYIFLSNLSSFAIIKVNGKNVFLEKDTINSKEISKNEYIEIYSGNGYKATLKTKMIKQYDEGGFCKGTLKINNKSEEIEYKIKGEFGC